MGTWRSNQTWRCRFSWIPATPGGCRAVTVGFFLLLLTPMAYRSQAGDYLSAEEIEKIRDSQKPHQRMSVLNGIFKRRMEGAISSQESKRGQAAIRRANSDRKGSNSGEVPGPRSFTGWMEEVVMCLEEIETNLENYPVDRPLSVWDLETGAPIRMDHKKFCKALKKLRSSLLESNQWLLDTLDRLEGTESQIAEETVDFLADLAEELKETIELAGGKVEEKASAKNAAKE